MRLATFTVENFRSITKARRIDLSAYTVLIGPNNEGKSNILTALSVALSSIRQSSRANLVRLKDGRTIRIGNSLNSNSSATREIYDWERDFPVTLQSKKPNGVTLIQVHFELNDAERTELAAVSKVKFNSELPIKVECGKNGIKVAIAKPGKGSVTANSHIAEICKLVASKIRFDYIPAIRTSGQIKDIVGSLLESGLSKIEENPEYLAAIKKIQEIEEPEFKRLSDSIAPTIQAFLPNVKSVKISPSSTFETRRYRSRPIIEIDDGTSTAIERKGDGIQSLVALALMRHTATTLGSSEYSIVAIEEPESHLHPSAIREVRRVLFDVAKGSQVIVSSHSPLFVNARSVKANVIVRNNGAASAQSISKIRESLGVGLNDSLHLAQTVLLVEGEDDVTSLNAILQNRSELIGNAISEGTLLIAPTKGCSKLEFNASFFMNAACNVHVYFDDDTAGRSAIASAIEGKIISNTDYQLATVLGRSETEFEDLLDQDLINDPIFSEFNVDIGKSPKSAKKLKWSDRVKECFKLQGKMFDGKIEAKLKATVSGVVANNVSEAINPHHTGSIDALINALEQKMFD